MLSAILSLAAASSYQAMRVTGAADPTVPVSQHFPGKLPSAPSVRGAAGYSSCSSQVRATGQVSELYHPGYVAKRMEIGAVVVGATPLSHVSVASIQKMAMSSRSSRRTHWLRWYWRCNWFFKAHDAGSIRRDGARSKVTPQFRREAGASSAVENACINVAMTLVQVAFLLLLANADGLDINLDAVLRNTTDLTALNWRYRVSRRMAVALEAKTLSSSAHTLARKPRGAIGWQQSLKTLVWSCVGAVRRLSTSAAHFLASKSITARLAKPVAYQRTWAGSTLGEKLTPLVRDLNVASNRDSPNADSTIGAGTVLMPFGGARQ